MDEHIDTTRLALSRSQINYPKQACRSFLFTLAFNIKAIKASLLLAAMHILFLFISTFQTPIELLSVITQNGEKDEFFQERTVKN